MEEKKTKKGQVIHLNNWPVSHEVPEYLSAEIYEDGTTNRVDINEKLAKKRSTIAAPLKAVNYRKEEMVINCF